MNMGSFVRSEQITAKKIVMLLLLIFLGLFGWWISDVPIGYYQFKKVCEKDGGLHIFGQIRKNVGWYSEGPSDAMYPFSFGNVAFVRTRNSQGSLVDIHKISGSWPQDYREEPMNEQISPTYEIRWKNPQGAEGIRLYKYEYEVVEIKTGEVKFSTTTYVFWPFKRDSIPLGSPAASDICPDLRAEEISSKIYDK